MMAAQKATQLDPSNAEGWRLLGNAYMIKDDNMRARKCLEHALNLEPRLDGAREALRLLSQVRLSQNAPIGLLIRSTTKEYDGKHRVFENRLDGLL